MQYVIVHVISIRKDNDMSRSKIAFLLCVAGRRARSLYWMSRAAGYIPERAIDVVLIRALLELR